MGNRAVITTKDNFENNGIGIYLHWNGGRDSVEAFLKYAELKGVRGVEDDSSYFWARLCQLIGNFFGGTTSLGIEQVNKLDCDNWDNGVYLIDNNFKIVGRRYFEGEEQTSYDVDDMVDSINKCQPEKEQINLGG